MLLRGAIAASALPVSRTASEHTKSSIVFAAINATVSEAASTHTTDKDIKTEGHEEQTTDIAFTQIEYW